MEKSLFWRNLLKFRSREIRRLCRGWCNIRVFSETSLLCDRAAENRCEERHPQKSSHWTSVDLHVGSHSEERSTKLSIVSAPFWSTIKKEQGIFVLPDTWTTDLQNVVGSDCPSRLECEVFRREQGVPAHTHQNSCVC